MDFFLKKNPPCTVARNGYINCGTALTRRPLRCLGFRRLRRLGLLHELAEPGRVVHGNVRQNLAVQLNAGLLQSADELRVTGPVQLARRGNTHNPQRAVLALLQPPARVRKLQAALNGFLGRLVEL